MFHHRRDTPGYVPTTSSAQWSEVAEDVEIPIFMDKPTRSPCSDWTASTRFHGYLRSTLAELAIKEPDDVEEEATSEQLTAEQLDQSDRERDASCSSGRYEQNRPGYVRSLGASRRDTPAYVYDSNTRIKSAFKCGGAESLIPEEVESKREEKNVEKLKSKSKKERRKCKEAANKKPEAPRRKTCVGSTEAPAFDHLAQTNEKAKSKND